MKKLILSIVSITSFGVYAQNVNIPDANFKAYLVGNASINTNADTEIQVSEANAFTRVMNCGTSSISDLTGIEAFTNLTSLASSNNPLTTVDLSQNTALTEINFQSNNLSSINLSSNTLLTNIKLDNNSLTTLDLSTLSNLTVMWAPNNSLTSLILPISSSLTTLVLENNNFTSLDISSQSNLVALEIRSNDLTSLNVANNNNSNFTYFRANFNPNLSCIQVDNVSYSNTNWASYKDITTSFSTNCVTSPILVSSIMVQGQGGVSTITTNGGTLQMLATVLPNNADDGTYTWSVTNGTGAATIDANGLLTATADGTVEVTAMANDASGTTGSKTIHISNQSVGINDLALKNVSIYPNPTNGFINLDIQEELTSIKIMDISGRTVQVFNPENTQFDISSFTIGIYFLEIANSEKKSMLKLIKK